MGIGEVLAPAGSMFSGSLGKVAQYAWVLFLFVGIAIAIGIVVIVKMIRGKKAQWTHRLIVRRVLQNGLLSKPMEIKMRRFPLIKRAEVFELETALLGGYLLPELDEYSGVNEFSIILDNNNRIYTNKGEYFDPDKNSVNVSAKHAEIDISRADLRADYQNINKTNKRIEWAQIAKYAMIALLIISVMIVSIIAIGQWGDNHEATAKGEQAKAAAMQSLAKAMESMEGIANAIPIITEELKELKGTNNINSLIRT